MDSHDPKKYSALGVYCVYTLTVLSCYNLFLEILVRLDDTSSDTVYATWIVIVFFLTLFAIMIRKTGYPLSVFGFTTRNWLKYCTESILFSIVFCILLLLKWYLITYTPVFGGVSLFENSSGQNTGSLLLIPTLLYLLLVPIQVFIAQGAIQSPLLEFLPTKNRNFLSVLVTTLLFSAVHVELSLVFALAVAVPSICWAIMYLRHRMLISIAISHAIIGFWAFAVLDFQKIFNDVDCAIVAEPLDPACLKKPSSENNK